MSENSAFWDDEVTGDAASATGWEAPYLDSEKAEILSLLCSSGDTIGYVVPEYEDELLVKESSTPAMSVAVASGIAFTNGRLYANLDTETLTIAANASGNPRIDRIVLRTSFAAQTIRLAVLQGTPGATPSLPALTQDANTWEVSLAYIWVANGATTILDEEIHDERLFLLSYKSINDSYGAINKIYNSEFMAIPYVSPVFSYPEGWAGSGNFVGTEYKETASKPDQMSRGQAAKYTIKATSTGNAGLEQTILVKPNTTYAIRSLFKVGPSNDGSIIITTNSFAPSTINRNILLRDVWLDEYFYYHTEHDATTMTVAFQIPKTINNVMYCGQTLVMEGYYAGNYRQFSETIFSTLWYFGSLEEDYSTETVVYDMGISGLDFGGGILDGTQSIIIAHRAEDNGFRTEFRTYGGTTVLGGVSPVTFPYMKSYKQIEVPLIDRKFEVDYTAVGVDTLAVYSYIIGIRT